MAFVQKYEKGKTLINELKDSAKEYVVENVNETTNPLKNTSENVPDKVNTSDTPIIKPTINTKAGDKITINGIDINKKLLIDNLKKKSFSATGLNRVAWDKILGKLENLSEYNSSNTLDIDYGSDLKYDVKDLENRGNLILSEILKEASSNKYSYEKPEEEPFTFTKFLGSELGLGKDYDYVNDYEILKSFEEDQYEPEYLKNKKTGLEEIVKNKYTTNLSTLKRSELISKYLDKEIDNVNNSSEDTKYLHNTIDKTEYLNRLNEAKSALDQLKRTKTIKNAAPEFYRIGIDVNKLLGGQSTSTDNTQVTPVGTPVENKDGSTTQTYSDNTKIITKLDGSKYKLNVDGTIEEIKPITTENKEDTSLASNNKEDTSLASNNNTLLKTKPALDILPEHHKAEDYWTYAALSLKNPYKMGTKHYDRWWYNPTVNPYDKATQPEEWEAWDQKAMSTNIVYQIKTAPKNFIADKSLIPGGDYINYIVNIAKTNPFVRGTKEYEDWANYKSGKLKYYNPYLEYDKHGERVDNIKSLVWDRRLVNEFLANFNTSQVWKPLTKRKQPSFLKSKYPNSRLWGYIEYTPRGADAELSPEEKYKAAIKANILSENITFDEFMQYMNKIKKGQLGLKFQPYSILDSNYEKYNKLINDVNSGKFTNYYKNQQLNQNKWKINLLDNFMFPIDINKSTTENKSIIENKNSIKHIPEEEKIKETITNKKAIGPSTILAGTELINNLVASIINKNIAKRYKDNLQVPTTTATQYVIPKVYQDPSRLNDFAALRNSSISKTSDINVYQSSQRDFNKQLGEYLFKEQNQQATGIRQDREKVNAIQNAQLEENTKVANANEAARVAFNNKLAEIIMGEQQKQGEISLATLYTVGNFIAGYKSEQQNSESKIDKASYDTKSKALYKDIQIIENDSTLKSEEKIDKIRDLNTQLEKLNEEYSKTLKNKYNSYFSKWDEKTTTPKTNIFN